MAARRTFDARPDTMDFRDRMFVPTLIHVPPARRLEEYLDHDPPILDQGEEGACTGFGLAAVAHHLLGVRGQDHDATRLSPRMFYEMAKRYDEWEGEDYSGSSARGAMKGWHKHGVCSEPLWPHDPDTPDPRLTAARADNAAERPLGAYFRVNHKDLVAMHAALAEVGILFAAAAVHQGWYRVGSDGLVPFDGRRVGGHAFAIVGYDQDGFWIQNSWGPDWGRDGFCFLSYSDWLENGMDVWVARPGVPIRVDERALVSGRTVGISTTSVSFAELRPHIVTIGNDGRLSGSGTFADDADDVEEILTGHFPRITRHWRTRRILLYAHGGLVPEKNAIQRIENYVRTLEGSQVYVLGFIWRTGFWNTIANVLKDAFRRRRAEGLLDDAKDFLLDRVDDALEPIARTIGGKTLWEEMKQNGRWATTRTDGGARQVAELLADLAAGDPRIEIHLAGHSAGAVFHAPLIQYLTASGEIDTGPMRGATGLDRQVASCSLWAPACTLDLFKATYLPAIEARRLKSFALFNLTEASEADDHVARIYNKSLLYLIANALEDKPRIPLISPSGEPLLGLDEYVSRDRAMSDLFRKRYADYILAPNHGETGKKNASRALHHGDFDDDDATVQATIARIKDVQSFGGNFAFRPSPAAASDRRRRLERAAAEE